MLLFALHADLISSTVRPHISLLPQLLLVTTRHAGERQEQGLALRQEQCGCSRFRSFPYSFWSLCFSFSAAASSFVQDSIKTCQKKGWFPRIIVLQIFLIQPGVPNDNPNDNETITKNRIIPCWIWMIWVRSDKNDECLEAPRVFRMRASQAGHLIPKAASIGSAKVFLERLANDACRHYQAFWNVLGIPSVVFSRT